MPRNNAQLGYVLAIAGASMFAWLGPLSRWAEASGMESLPFVAWRAGVGALILAVVVALRVARTRGAPAAPRHELAVLGTATIVALVLNLAICGAFARVPIAVALLAFYTYPAMIAGVAIVSGTERPSPGIVLALLLALAGMAVVVAGGFDPAGSAIDPVGVALALLAAASQTAFVTLSRRGYRSIPADQAMAVILGGTFAGCVVIAVLTGGAPQLVMPFGQPAPLLLILVVAGSIGAAVPSLFFLGAIRLIGGMRTGILMLFEPVVAVTLAAVLLHESLRPVQALGAFGVLGAALVLRRASAGGPDDDRTQADDELFGIGVTGGP